MRLLFQLHAWSLMHPQLLSSFGFEGKVPKTSQEMANAFLSSALGQANRDTIEDYRHCNVGNTERMDAYRQSVVMEHANIAPKNNP